MAGLDVVGRLHRVLGRRGRGRACGVAALLLVVLAGCGPAGTPAGSPPTEAHARALLEEIVASAQRADFEALCGFGDANCPDVLAMAGRDRLPPRPPIVAGSWVLPPRDGREGGLVLQLCGVDAAGTAYATEMLVQSGRGRLVAIHPIYWSGLRVPRDGLVGGHGSPAFACGP